MNKVELKIKRLNGNNLPLPEYKTSGSAGFDLQAYIGQEILLEAGEIKMVPTGLAFEIPVGYEVQIRPRSGLAAKHGISIVNSPGTIDSDYRGEIKVILINLSEVSFVVKPGERIAQAVLKQVTIAEIVEVSDISETIRGEGGFGHTGRV